MRELIGDVESFMRALLAELRMVAIRPAPGRLSHLGCKAATVGDYRRVRDGLLGYAARQLENEHNGRPIAKIILRDELLLPAGLSVDMIEVMPPKPEPAPVTGLEHAGFVVAGLDEFVAAHADVLTGRQDQGPYCRPAYIRFPSGRRAKFYEHSLETVVGLEGKSFADVG
jgi:predicted metalloenzyme YecM